MKHAEFKRLLAYHYAEKQHSKHRHSFCSKRTAKSAGKNLPTADDKSIRIVFQTQMR